MLIALYRWKVRHGFEEQFINCWTEITLYYRENHGSFGSRLHHGNDGLFYGYAKWPSAERRANAFKTGEEHPARPALVEAIEETYPEILLEVASDLLIWNSQPLTKE